MDIRMGGVKGKWGVVCAGGGLGMRGTAQDTT